MSSKSKFITCVVCGVQAERKHHSQKTCLSVECAKKNSAKSTDVKADLSSDAVIMRNQFLLMPVVKAA